VKTFRYTMLCSVFLCAAPLQTQAQAIRVVESQEALNISLEEKPAIHFASERTPELTIVVDDQVAYQPIEGFGASLTDSSAWLMKTYLTDEQRKDALRMLFDPAAGIGLNLLRQPMGSSDFALDDYSYDDMPPGAADPELKNFSIEKDQRYIIPMLRETFAVNPGLKIIATPWSPPGWMKTSQAMIRGALLPSAYRPLASYFVKFVQAYQKAGVPIYALTMQNEPVNVPTDYPGMDMTPLEQQNFLRDALGPAFRDAGLKTKILVFDHNWNLIYYPLEVLSDSKAAAFAAGIATHCYGGSASAQLELHNRFPDKEIWFTECSGGDWQKGRLLEQQEHLVIEVLRNWSRSVILWNLALDQNHEPYLGGCTTCRGIITVKHEGGSSQVIPTVDFTALGHASKFVRPGAVRIESNSFGAGSLEDVAFRNADGSIVLLVLNSSNQPLKFNIGWRGRFAPYTLTEEGVATFVWEAASAK
jgi:glucosylceramidase